MDQNIGAPLEEAPKKRNTGLIIAIVVIVVICCCTLLACAAIYYGYDLLDDPFGFYGSLPLNAL